MLRILRVHESICKIIILPQQLAELSDMRLQQWVSEGDLNSDGVIDEQEFRLMGSNSSNPTPDMIDSVYLAGCYVRHWAKSCTRIG